MNPARGGQRCDVKPYSPERKEALLRRLLPPESIPLAQLAREAGVSEQTLYNWRRKLKEQGSLVPEPSKNVETWSSAEKFAVVLETAAFNEAELAEFCRSRGLLVEQIAAWKQACMAANAKADTQAKVLREQLAQEKKRSKKLERELQRKDKALAETAALLVLRKKLNAIWGEGEDD